jgi:RNA polymerase sigma factor (sigma-70 family)
MLPLEERNKLIEQCTSSEYNLPRILAIRHWDKRFGNAVLEDMYSKALESLVLASQTYNPNQGTKFSTWAFKKIDNTMRNYYRDHLKNKIKEVSIDAIGEDTLNLHAIHPDVENKLYIQELMSKLGEMDQEIVYKYHFEGYTLKELGEKFGFSKQYISERLHKAYKKMKDST